MFEVGGWVQDWCHSGINNNGNSFPNSLILVPIFGTVNHVYRGCIH